MVSTNVRGGAEIRKRVNALKDSKNSKFKCPRCEKKSVKRDSNSIWICKSCKAVYAGGTYSLTTPSGEASRRFTEKS